MQHFEIDWFEFARQAAVWRTLEPRTRLALLRLAPSEAVQLDQLGEDGKRLVAESFVAVSGTGRAALHPAHRPHARALRAMSRHDVLGAGGVSALYAYMRENYTVVERQRISGHRSYYYADAEDVLIRRIMSAGPIRYALELAAGTNAGRGASEPARGGAERGRAGADHMHVLELDTPHRRSTIDAAHVVAAVLARGGQVPVDELPELVASEVPAQRFSRAVEAALAEGLVLATLHESEPIPVLAIWPAAVARLSRPDPAPPEPVTAVEQFCAAFHADDAAAVLVAAAAEPMRLRGNDGTLYANARKRLCAALTPLPAWSSGLADWENGVRVSAAIQSLSDLALLRRAGTSGRDLRLESTPAAGEWLAAPASDRLRSLHDLVRPTDEDADSTTSRPMRDWGDIAALDDEYDPDTPHLFAHTIQPDGLRRAVEEAAADAFDSVAQGETVSFDQFLDYHSRMPNPLDSEEARHPGAYVANIPTEDLTEEQRELLWQDLLGYLLVNRLVPLGGASLAHLDSGVIGFGITALGRYLLGRTDMYDAAVLAPAAGAGARVLVQPNFDVVFLGPSPSAEAEIGRFAERTGAGVGTLFRITRESVFTAAAAGLDADVALDCLRSLSSEPVPQNVAREIGGWFAACRRITSSPAWLLRCPDEETATRALAAAGRAAVLISPTILEVTDARKRKDIARKLRKQGIFVDELEQSGEPGRGGRPRRKRRW